MEKRQTKMSNNQITHSLTPNGNFIRAEKTDQGTILWATKDADKAQGLMLYDEMNEQKQKIKLMHQISWWEMGRGSFNVEHYQKYLNATGRNK